MGNSNLVSTGIDGFDKSIDMLRLGDSIVCQVGTIKDYKKFITPFINKARADNRNIVYFKFANKKPMFDDPLDDTKDSINDESISDDLTNIKIFDLDPNIGFNYFTLKVHEIIKSEGENSFYIFDNLTSLQRMWHSDSMILNFFHVTCSYLHKFNTVSCFAILRKAHSYVLPSQVRQIAKVIFDMYTINNKFYIHPLKVSDRFSPTMFLPLEIDGTIVTQITSSDDTVELFSNINWRSSKRLSYWRRTLNAARNALNKDEKTQEDMQKLLIYSLIGCESKIFNMSMKYFSLEDLLKISSRLIGTGYIGGKSVGMLLATQILTNSDESKEYFKPILEKHDSFFIGTDIYYSYIVENNLWDLRTKQKTDDGYFKYAPELKKAIEDGDFPEDVKDQFMQILEYFGQSPIIVRSSSLLEDNFGNAFAGKYESVFCINQGTPKERLNEFVNAIKVVYASTMSQDAINYRKTRGLDKKDEQMAILVQRVSGDYHGQYFFPHLAGVGNSSNLYVYDENVNMEDGMIRLVFGLGTRAVDRIIGDYVRIVTLDDPMRLPIMNSTDEQKYSQHSVDVLDLTTNKHINVNIDKVINENLKTDTNLFGSKDYNTQVRLRELGLNPNNTPYILNFKRLLKYSSFPEAMKKALHIVSKEYDYPVDIEFTANFKQDGSFKINIVQCRPLQTRGLGKSVELPKLLNKKDCLFSSKGNFMGGNIRLPIDNIIYVSVNEYLSLNEVDKYKIARQIGILNNALKGKNTMLMGPGRWGTSTPSLGVPVHFTELNNMSVMCEIAYSDKDVVPELSYGSHFFQDLVETGIFYVALFDNKDNVVFNEDSLKKLENIASTFSDSINTDVIKVYNTKGLEIYSDIKEQIVMCK
ncbi:PEP/pyruvate-binding domain-containing protein [Intestinibacter sp.]